MSKSNFEIDGDSPGIAVSRQDFVRHFCEAVAGKQEALRKIDADRTRLDSLWRARDWENPGSKYTQDGLENAINDVDRKLKPLEASVKRLRNRLQPSARQWFSAEFDKLRAIPRLHFFQLVDNTLFVRTQMLYAFQANHNSTWHQIGEFEIAIPLRPDSLDKIRYINTTYPGDKSRPQAPQIRGEGVVGCWGSPADKRLRTAVRDLRIADAVSIVIRFAECSDQNNWFGNWPEVSAMDVPDWYHTVSKW